MKPKSKQRNYKPFNELPPDFKNLIFNYLIDTNPSDLQIASNSQYELENIWSVIFLAGTKGISIPEAVKHLKCAGVTVLTTKTIWNNVKDDSLDEMTHKASNTLTALPAVCSRKTKRRLKRCPMLALDWTDVPFYGEKKNLRYDR